MRILAGLALVAALSACAGQPVQEEIIVLDPEPITVEPVFTGKFK